MLEDGTRVLSQQGFLEAIGRARKAKGGHGAGLVDNPPAFLAPKNLKPFVSKELAESTTAIPFQFQTPEGRRGYGYKAAFLPQVCSVCFVYERVAPGVLEELRARNPILPTGSRRNRHYQWFTPDLGHPKLKEHLAAITALMRAAPNWENFKRSTNRALPKYGETIELPFDDWPRKSYAVCGTKTDHVLA